MAIRVVIFPEGNHLVAQCLEHDIAAQGATIHELQDSFERTFVSHVVLAIENGQKPLANLKKAPVRYWKLWERAQKLQFPLPVRLPTKLHPPLPRVPKEALMALA